jgi:putative transposase
LPRTARIVAPGHPHHVIQRGHEKQRTFFSDDDYAHYLRILATESKDAGVGVWAYCLMPNHIHAVLTPPSAEALAAAVGETNRQYARHVQERIGRQGKFWQGRFSSAALDERHLLAAIRYVSLNPVKAKMVRAACDWRWSSARAHATGAGDGVVDVFPLLNRIGSFEAFLANRLETEETIQVRRATRSGKPTGDIALTGTKDTKAPADKTDD